MNEDDAEREAVLDSQANDSNRRSDTDLVEVDLVESPSRPARNSQSPRRLRNPSVLSESSKGHRGTAFQEKPYYSKRRDFGRNYEGLGIKLRKLNSYEWIDRIAPNCWCTDWWRMSLRLKEAASEFCRLLVGSSGFEYFITFVIVTNIAVLALQDEIGLSDSELMIYVDTCFLYIYTGEALLKIGGAGFLLDKKAYLRDSWNIMDFAILSTWWAERVLDEGVNLSALRVVRVLRPLRSISSISGLKVLITALANSLKPLGFAAVVFLFYLFIFAIAGVHLWMGTLKLRCMDIHSGVLTSTLCGNTGCSFGYECAKALDNPNYGVTHFDNLLYAFLTVFQCVTLEDWTGIMKYTQRSYSYYSILFFIPLVFIGAFLILNFILAVIKYTFTQAMDDSRHHRLEEDCPYIDLDVPKEKCRHLSGLRRDSQAEHTSRLAASEEDESEEHLCTSIDVVEARFGGEGDEEAYMRNGTEEHGPYLFCAIVDHRSAQPVHHPTKKPVQKSDFRETSTHTTQKDRKSLRPKPLQHISRYYIYYVPDTDQVQFESTDDVLESCLLATMSEPTTLYIVDETDIDSQDPSSRPVRAFVLLALKKSFRQAFFQLQASAYSAVTRGLLNPNQRLGWSGLAVDPMDVAVHKEWAKALSTQEWVLWDKGWKSLQRLRACIRNLVKHRAFWIFIMICVQLNTVVLSLDHYPIDEDFSNALAYTNLTFTVVFVLEMALKLLGLGVRQYFADAMNCLDALVVVTSGLEIVFFNGTSGFSAFRTIRLFKVFKVLRVLRVARLFRYVGSMAAIMRVLSKSIYSFIYLALLLLLFIIVFSLLGMQIFEGKFEFEDGVPRANFDSFHSAFLTVFQVLSMENWQEVLYDGMRSSVGPASCLYFIAWIVLGNFVLLNLFLAIVLDSFDQDVEENPVEDGELNKNQPQLFGAIVAKKRQRKHQEQLQQLEEIQDESKELEKLRKVKQVTQVELFKGISCDRSLCVFSKSHWLRVACHRLTVSPAFENAVLLLICLSSLKLVWDTYLLGEDDTSFKLQLSNYMDIAFTAVFGLEFVLKVISMGFFYEQGTYLREGWNVLDLLIVIVSVLELSVQSVSLPFIKVLRLLRTLRPLRFISHNLSMKLVVTALMESLCAIVNVVFVLLLVWLMFAILGVSLFAGTFYSCEMSQLQTREDCEAYGYAWVTADSNYDNVLQALVSLFIVSSLEDWPTIMHQAIDARGEDIAPEQNSNQLAAYYFVAFVLVGSFFFVNLFIGVVFMQFNKAKHDENAAYPLMLGEHELRWIEIQRLVLASKPQFRMTRPPQTRLSQRCLTIAKHWTFNVIITACILLNAVQMAVFYEGASATYIFALETINLVFTAVFIIEAVIKLLAFGCRGYFHSNWNRFDFAVVVTSIADMVLSAVLNSTQSLLRIGPQLIRLVRVVRVSKVLQACKSLEPLEDLVTVIGLSLPAILNILSLLVLVFFIYAVLGVFLFYSVPIGSTLDDLTNFQNFGTGMMTLLTISTGERWNAIMYDVGKSAGTAVSTLYFCSFITVTSFIMLNLFVMVIVQAYQDYKKNPEHLSHLFNSDLKLFKTVWAQYSRDSNGVRIEYRTLPKFIKGLGKLDSSLGTPSEASNIKVITFLSTLDIIISDDGHIYYNDLLYAVMKKKYYKRKKAHKNTLSKRILIKEDLSTAHKLEQLRNKAFASFQRRASQQELRNHRKHFVFTFTYLRGVFKSWKNWTRNKRGRNAIQTSFRAAQPPRAAWV